MPSNHLILCRPFLLPPPVLDGKGPGWGSPRGGVGGGGGGYGACLGLDPLSSAPCQTPQRKNPRARFAPAGLCLPSSIQSLSRVQLFATPRAEARQASLSMSLLRQELWSRLPFPSPGDLPDPVMEPRSPVLQANSLSFEMPCIHIIKILFYFMLFVCFMSV